MLVLCYLLEKEMETHSSILSWKIPWTEEPGGLQSQRVRRDWVTEHFTIWTFKTPFCCLLFIKLFLALFCFVTEQFSCQYEFNFSLLASMKDYVETHIEYKRYWYLPIQIPFFCYSLPIKYTTLLSAIRYSVKKETEKH